jgi:hypothetical protein
MLGLVNIVAVKQSVTALNATFSLHSETVA